jgi:hypothetical protein
LYLAWNLSGTEGAHPLPRVSISRGFPGDLRKTRVGRAPSRTTKFYLAFPERGARSDEISDLVPCEFILHPSPSLRLFVSRNYADPAALGPWPMYIVRGMPKRAPARPPARWINDDRLISPRAVCGREGLGLLSLLSLRRAGSLLPPITNCSFNFAEHFQGAAAGPPLVVTPDSGAFQ